MYDLIKQFDESQYNRRTMKELEEVRNILFNNDSIEE